MTKDEYRVKQKSMCGDGGGRAGKYGCPCCRMISNLGAFKKVSRRLARVRFNRDTAKQINAHNIEE